jgi:hypothetical protein
MNYEGNQKTLVQQQQSHLSCQSCGILDGVRDTQRAPGHTLLLDSVVLWWNPGPPAHRVSSTTELHLQLNLHCTGV